MTRGELLLKVQDIFRDVFDEDDYIRDYNAFIDSVN